VTVVALSKSADCRPSRRHWSAHRHRGGKDGLFVASTSTPAAQAQNQAGLPVPSTSTSTIRASHVLQLASSCCRERRQTWPSTPDRLQAAGGLGTDGALILGPWCRWKMVNLFCCRNWDEVRNNKVLVVAAKVLLALVPNVAAQPRSASEHQIWFHGDMFGGNEFEQSANRLERFTRADRRKISLRSTVSRCGLAARASAQARLASCTRRCMITARPQFVPAQRWSRVQS
jgi:hypothetical protein